MGAGASVEGDERDKVTLVIDRNIKTIEQLAPGYKLNGNKLVPINDHAGEDLFDRLQLRELVKMKLTPSLSAEINNVTADTVEEAAKDLEMSVSAEGEYGLKGAGSVSGSVSAEFGLRTSSLKNHSFVQIRRSFFVGSVVLPHQTQLRSLMTEDARRRIDGCHSREDAEEVVDIFGAFFITRASFGGLWKSTVVIEKKAETCAKNVEAALTAKYESISGSVKGSVTFGLKDSSGKETSNVTATITVLGGKISDINSVEEWETSVVDTPVVVKYALKEIYHLATNATAKDILKRYIDEIKELNSSVLREIDKNNESEKAQVQLPFHLRHRGKKIQFQSLACGKFILLADSNCRDGTRIHSYHDCGPGEASQHWFIEAIDDPGRSNVVGIRTVRMPLYFNLHCGETHNGAMVHMWGNSAINYNTNKWVLHYMADDVVCIQAYTGDRFINLDDNRKHEDGCMIHMWGGEETKSWLTNQWKLKLVG